MVSLITNSASQQSRNPSRMGRFIQRRLPSRSGALLDPRQSRAIRLLSHLLEEFLLVRMRLRRLDSLRRLSCSSSEWPHAVVFQARPFQVFNAAEEQNNECLNRAVSLVGSKGLARTKSAPPNGLATVVRAGSRCLRCIITPALQRNFRFNMTIH
jgi:hypothetical protein